MWHVVQGASFLFPTRTQVPYWCALRACRWVQSGAARTRVVPQQPPRTKKTQGVTLREMAQSLSARRQRGCCRSIGHEPSQPQDFGCACGGTRRRWACGEPRRRWRRKRQRQARARRSRDGSRAGMDGSRAGGRRKRKRQARARRSRIGSRVGRAGSGGGKAGGRTALRAGRHWSQHGCRDETQARACAELRRRHELAS